MPIYNIEYKDRKGDQEDPEEVFKVEIEAQNKERALDFWSEKYCGDEVIDIDIIDGHFEHKFGIADDGVSVTIQSWNGKENIEVLRVCIDYEDEDVTIYPTGETNFDNAITYTFKGEYKA